MLRDGRVIRLSSTLDHPVNGELKVQLNFPGNDNFMALTETGTNFES